MTPQTIDRLVNSSDETVSQDLQRTMQQAVAEAQPRQNQVRHVPAGTGAAYWGPGELMTFLITGEETGGAFFMADLSVVPGGGTPPHIHHREDDVPPARRHADDSSGRGYNDCIAWRFCLPSPRNRSFLQEHGRRDCEGPGIGRAGGP